MKKLSQDDLDWAFRKREQGWSCASIAKRLGVSAGAINYQCLKNAVISPNQRLTPTPIKSSSFRGRDGRTFRTFTVADDQRMLSLEAAGFKSDQIAEKMGRARTSVRMRLLLLGQRSELPA